MTCGILVLAAGRAVRFGSDKRLATFPDGRRVIDTALANVHGSGLPFLVCVSAGDDVLVQHLYELNMPCVRCARAAEGMGGTLSEGVAHVAGWSGVLVALADMPWIVPATFRAVAERLAAADIVVPVHGSSRGHPVGFGRDFFADLAALNGDSGARGLLHAHAARVIEVPVADAAIHRDIDVPSDLR